MPNSKKRPGSELGVGQPDLFSFSGAQTRTVATRLTETVLTKTKGESSTLSEAFASEDIFLDEVEIAPPLGPVIYSVSEISAELKDTLNDRFGEIVVQGEICDFKGIHRSGHLYFALKDEKSQIRAVMWRPAVQRVPFDIKGGLEVIVTGRVDYYAGSGSLQMVIEKMEPVGIGALQLKFEQLKEKLRLEGLFDAARKRKIKALNWRIGVVTGKSTAAFQDLLKIFKTRFPLVEIFFFHAAVQGDKAPNEICEAIELANRYSEKATKPIDVLIIGRGGGSYEDLFSFNDEKLARTIAASKIPTVSAVGHEIDFTIADMVADKRAATPSHAAQETVPEAELWFERLSELTREFSRQMIDAIHDRQQKIDTLYNRITSAAPQKKLQAQRGLLKQYELRLNQLMKAQMDRRHSQISRLASVMDALSPLKVLDRGYAMTTTAAGKVVKSVHDAKSGEDIQIRLADGNIAARVL